MLFAGISLVRSCCAATAERFEHHAVSADLGSHYRTGYLCGEHNFRRYGLSVRTAILLPGGFMDILAALKQEEAKYEKQANAVQQQLDTVRAAMKLLGGMSCSGKTVGKKKRKKNVMSATTRAKMAKAAKERWAKIRAEKKGKA
jgi:hypothetical protein